MLTDIAGAEDHYGDMDFKVAGTGRRHHGAADGYQGCGHHARIMRKALEQARQRPPHILEKMQATLERAATNISAYAPRIVTIRIPVDKIRDVIGPGGKMIRSIIERTGVKIDVEDDGRVNVASADEASAQKAIGIIQELTATPELNKTYLGKVQRITDFGAFVEIMPGLDGLLHVSEIAQLPRQGRPRRAERRRAGDGQGDQHRPLREDSTQPEGAAGSGRRPGASRRRWFTGWRRRRTTRASWPGRPRTRPRGSRAPARAIGATGCSRRTNGWAGATLSPSYSYCTDLKSQLRIAARVSTCRRLFHTGDSCVHLYSVSIAIVASSSLAAAAGARPRGRKIREPAGLCDRRRDDAFRPNTITVDRNDVVKIVFTAEDIAHSFTIDSYRISKRAGAGQSVTFEFRADQPGTFDYYCNLSVDSKCKTMRGKLIVK